MTYYSPIVAATVTTILILFILSSQLGTKVQDIPNERSLHKIPVPRIGGLGLVAGLMAGWTLIWQPWLLPITVSVLILMLVSFFDDLRGLSAGWRFLMHFFVASIFVWKIMVPDIGWLVVCILAVAMVWMINLYNFMDGSDGLAGGMTFVGFGCYAIAAWLGGEMDIAISSFTIASSALAFLYFNFHPARIFMGDAGSIPLGFLAAGIGLYGFKIGAWGLWFPFLVFSPFVVDATITLMKRLFRAERIWEAHKSHYYQRLIQMGWGHRKTALCEYALMASVGSSAIWLVRESTLVQLLGLGAWLLIYAVMMLMIDYMWKKGIQ